MIVIGAVAVTFGESTNAHASKTADAQANAASKATAVVMATAS